MHTKTQINAAVEAAVYFLKRGMVSAADIAEAMNTPHEEVATRFCAYALPEIEGGYSPKALTDGLPFEVQRGIALHFLNNVGHGGEFDPELTFAERLSLETGRGIREANGYVTVRPGLSAGLFELVSGFTAKGQEPKALTLGAVTKADAVMVLRSLAGDEIAHEAASDFEESTMDAFVQMASPETWRYTFNLLLSAHLIEIGIDAAQFPFIEESPLLYRERPVPLKIPFFDIPKTLKEAVRRIGWANLVPTGAPNLTPRDAVLLEVDAFTPGHMYRRSQRYPADNYYHGYYKQLSSLLFQYSRYGC